MYIDWSNMLEKANLVKLRLHFDLMYALETLNENPWWMRPTIEISDYATDDPAYVEYVKEHDPLQYVGQQKIEEEAQIIVIDKWKKTDE